MKKKFLAVLLAASMVASLSACGGGSDASSDNTPADTSSSDSSSSDDSAPADDSAAADDTTASSDDPWADVDTSEHVVITYMTTGDAPSGTKEKYDEMMAQLNAILTEKVNAELDINFISWTDYLSNYNLTLARMDGSVDLVGTASDWLDAWPNAKNGAFLELSEEMLQKYAPKTWASVPAENWDLCKYDGNIYLMPEDNSTVHNYLPVSDKFRRHIYKVPSSLRVHSPRSAVHKSSAYPRITQGMRRSLHSATHPASQKPYLPGLPYHPYEPVSGYSWKDNPSMK